MHACMLASAHLRGHKWKFVRAAHYSFWGCRYLLKVWKPAPYPAVFLLHVTHCILGWEIHSHEHKYRA